MKNKYGMQAGWWEIKVLDILGQDIAEAKTGKKMLTISIDNVKFKKQCCSEKQFRREIKFEGKVLNKGKKELVRISFYNDYVEGVFTYCEFNTNVCEV